MLLPGGSLTNVRTSATRVAAMMKTGQACVAAETKKGRPDSVMSFVTPGPLTVSRRWTSASPTGPADMPASCPQISGESGDTWQA